ncbi:MAG: class I SAM-dependent methyltransferase [Deltaproteobacteria bacterium]|nr:class I SAM-dependent methyltransferase [Deltaproteobacteria bacterium]
MHTPPLSAVTPSARAPLGAAPYSSEPFRLERPDDTPPPLEALAHPARARRVPEALDARPRHPPRRPVSPPPTLVPELQAIAAQRPEPCWDSFRSRVGADQFRALHAVLARRITAGSRVLDWGAATGHLSYTLVRLGYRAVGFGLGEWAFRGCVDDARYAFVRGGRADLGRLPFADASFDAVVSTGLLEHVREVGGDEGESLSEIHRILRPGGLFVCDHLPNQTSWMERAAQTLGGHPHRRRFAEWDIRRLLHDADLTLLEWARYGFLPSDRFARLPAWIRASESIATAWNLADSVGASLGNKLCQNHLFVARRPSV